MSIYLSYVYDEESKKFINIGGSDYTKIYYGTVEQWNASHEISKKQALYVYTDAIKEQEHTIPKFKIGDGLAYVVDLPFVGDDVSAILVEHISNSVSHITSQERLAWNSKCKIDESDLVNENLILTID